MVSARTGWPIVCIMWLAEGASLIWNVCFSAAAYTLVHTTLRYFHVSGTRSKQKTPTAKAMSIRTPRHIDWRLVTSQVHHLTTKTQHTPALTNKHTPQLSIRFIVEWECSKAFDILVSRAGRQHVSVGSEPWNPALTSSPASQHVFHHQHKWSGTGKESPPQQDKWKLRAVLPLWRTVELHRLKTANLTEHKQLVFNNRHPCPSVYADAVV